MTNTPHDLRNDWKNSIEDFRSYRRLLKKALASIRYRSSVVLFLFLCCTGVSSGVDFYLTPSGSGAQDGSSWSSTYPLTQLQNALNTLAPGDTLYLGSGTYNLSTPISISGSGSSGNYKTVQGVDTGGGLPLFQGIYDPNNSASNSTTFFNFGSGSISYWKFKDFSIKNYSRGFRLWAAGSSYTLRHDLEWDNVDADSVEDFLQLYNASDVLVQNCDVIRYCKKAFRYGAYTKDIVFDTCTADAKGAPLFADELSLGQDNSSYPTRAIPAGFQGMDNEGTIHDITFIDCVARNNRYYPQTGGDSGYWNGDGFVSEENSYNISYIRCKAFNNYDGGFDDKSDDVVYQDCISIGNGRGFRYWGDNGVFINCLSAYSKNYNYPNTNTSAGLWVGRHPRGTVGVAHVYGSTFHNNFKFALETYDGGLIYAENCILSAQELPEFSSNYFDNTYLYSSSGVTLTDTELYHLDRGQTTDPQYVQPSKTWEGIPSNSYDSALYSPGQGYFGVAGNGSAVTISATDGSAGEPSNDGEFTVTVSPAPTSSIDINLSIGGSATSGSDYAAIASTVSVGSSGSATISVDVLDDSVTESAETVVLSLASGSGYDLGSPQSATVSIADDDAGPIVSVQATDSNAGEPSNDGAFTLSASPAPSSNITLNLLISGSAVNGTDYVSIPSSVTMGTSGVVVVDVEVYDDAVVEGLEDVILEVQAGSGYAVSTSSSDTVTISDDDASNIEVEIEATDPNAGEPINNARFTVSASPAPSSPITVNLIVSGTATNGSDYQTISSSVVVGTSGSELIYVTPIDDSLVEGSETVTLSVDVGAGYVLGNETTDTVTITDNDSGGTTPSVSIAATDSTAGEPSNSGKFTLTASPAPSSSLTVNLSISGSASNGTDYSTIPSSVVVGTGGAATIDVNVIDDTYAEGSETVQLSVASGSGYTVGSPGSATVTISDNDSGGSTPVVTVVASDSSAGEPSNPGEFTFSASPAPSSPITVYFSYYGSASNGYDFTSLPSSISIGSSGTATLALTVIDDSNVEGAESASISISGGSGYGAGTPSNATIYITSDD